MTNVTKASLFLVTVGIALLLVGVAKDQTSAWTVPMAGLIGFLVLLTDRRGKKGDR